MASSSHHCASSCGLPPRPVPIVISSDSSDDGYESVGPMPPPYRPNQKVEVVGGEVGMLGSFYEATLVRKVDPSHWKVEYVTLLHDNRRELPKETIPVLRIRPHPPRISYYAYVVDDRVDCHVNDGYWSGKLVDVCGFRNDRTFKVNFPLTGDTNDYRARSMRPHFHRNGSRFTTHPHFRYLLP